MRALSHSFEFELEGLVICEVVWYRYFPLSDTNPYLGIIGLDANGNGWRTSIDCQGERRGLLDGPLNWQGINLRNSIAMDKLSKKDREEIDVMLARLGKLGAFL